MKILGFAMNIEGFRVVVGETTNFRLISHSTLSQKWWQHEKTKAVTKVLHLKPIYLNQSFYSWLNTLPELALGQRWMKKPERSATDFIDRIWPACAANNAVKTPKSGLCSILVILALQALMPKLLLVAPNLIEQFGIGLPVLFKELFNFPWIIDNPLVKRVIP